MKKNKKTFILNAGIILLLIIGFSLPFLASSFTNNFYIEESANYCTEVVLNKTKDKKYLSLVAESTDGSISPDPASEFHNLYGVFKQTNATFASVIDHNKSTKTKIKNITNELSMFYYGPMGTVAYNGHYKHYIYPLEMMFNDSRSSYDVSRYIASISQSHADKILSEKGISKNEDGQFSLSDYKSLINTLVSFEVNGNQYDFAISNIYYQFNYYYEALNETIGDFVMVSYYLPENLRAKQVNMYFLNQNEFENEYFMKYLNNTYNVDSFSLSINMHNVIREINHNKALNFYYGSASNESIAILLFVLSAILIIVSLVLIYFTCLKFKVINHLLVILPIFAIYFIFKYIEDVHYFGYSGRKFYLLTFVIFIFAYIFEVIFVKRKAQKKKENDEKINI